MSGDSSVEQIAQWLAIYGGAARQPHPYQNEVWLVIRHLKAMATGVDSIVDRWKNDYLIPALSHTKNAPNQDFDAYSKPILTLAEMLRQMGFHELAHRLLHLIVQITNEHCAVTGKDLHRGAMYSNYGIALLELHEYELGLSQLLAAANEDVRFHRVSDLNDSYAWKPDGIYGQWTGTAVLKCLHPDVLSFVASQTGVTIGLPELMEMLRALKGTGDLSLLRGVVEFNAVRSRTDYIGNSVRFMCLRDLSSLFEVLLKQIGRSHRDPKVQAAFDNSPMLANIIHFMHYPQKKKTCLSRTFNKLSPRATHQEGLYWNSVRKQPELLLAIKKHFNYVKNSRNSLANIWHTLPTRNHLSSTHAKDEATAKRILLAYRLRNQTSHSFAPDDPGIVANAEEFHRWLLQAVFYTYFWFTKTGQATL